MVMVAYKNIVFATPTFKAKEIRSNNATNILVLEIMNMMVRNLWYFPEVNI